MLLTNVASKDGKSKQVNTVSTLVYDIFIVYYRKELIPVISTRELASLAGVSQSTISRCINDHPAISAETKERVRKLAKEHGYLIQKKRKKTILSSKRKAIGIMLTSQPFFDDLFINHVMNLLYNKIESENYYAIPLLNYTTQTGSIEKLRDLIRLNIMEGFIIINREYDEELNTYLNELGLPHVYLLHCSRNSFESIDIIDSDNYCGGYLGTKHLLDNGHRNIMTITSPWREFEDRTTGYNKALAEYGVETNSNYVLCASCTYNDAYRLIQDNLGMLETVTAIYAQSDLMAFGAINALKDHGFQVPEDISVVGSDGYELGLMCRPQLDSVAHPINDLVELAVNHLTEIAGSSGKQIPRQLIVRPYVITRGSVAKREND